MEPVVEDDMYDILVYINSKLSMIVTPAVVVMTLSVVERKKKERKQFFYFCT